MKEVLNRRWLYLIMAVIILLFMGIGYAFSLFVVPIEEDLGLVRSQTSFVFTLCFICFSLGSFTGGFLIRKLSPQIIIRIVAIIIATGFITSTLASKAWHLYISYSLCCGFSIGLIYNVCVSILPLYFQDKLGLATGILLMGYAMSTTVFGQLCEKGITIISWKGVFIALGISTFCVLMIGSFLIHYPFKDQVYLPQQKSDNNEKINYRPIQVLKSPTFYVFVLFYIFMGGIGMSLINHMAPAIHEDLIISSSLTATIVSFVSLFNGVGRVVWGIVFDHKGASFIFKVLGSLVSIALLMMIYGLKYQNVIFFALGASIIMFCYGGSSSLAPIVVRHLYGNDYFSINFSITNIGTLILSTYPTLIGTIQTMTNHYLLGFIVLFVFGIGTLGLSLIYLPVARKEFKQY